MNFTPTKERLALARAGDAEIVIKLSNSTRGVIKARLGKVPDWTLVHMDLTAATNRLDDATRRLREAAEDRATAKKAFENERKSFDEVLRGFNKSSAEIDQIQDSVTVVIVALGVVFTGPVSGPALIVGGIVNSATRADPNAESDGVADAAVDAAGDELVEQGLEKGLDLHQRVADSFGRPAGSGLAAKLVGPVAGGYEAFTSTGVNAQLGDVELGSSGAIDRAAGTNFQNVRNTINDASYWQGSGKEAAAGALDKLEGAHREFTRADRVYQRRLDQYLEALSAAMGATTWVAPRR